MAKCLVFKLPLRSRYGIQAPTKFPCDTPLWADPHPTLNQDNHKSVFYSYSFAFSKMSYKSNNMYFLSLTPFTKQNAFEIHPCSCVCQEFIPLQKKKVYSFFIVEQCSFYGCKSLTILKSMDIWTVSNFWLLQVKLL